MVRGQAGTNPGMPMSSPARRWTGSRLGITACATKCSLVSEQAGLSRLLASAGSRQDSHFTREHLSVHLCPVGAYEGLLLETLPRAKSKRGWRGRRGGMVIAQRDHSSNGEADDRQTPGHWEADRCCSIPTDRRDHRPPTARQGRRSDLSPAPSPRSSLPSRRSCGGRSPSTDLARGNDGCSPWQKGGENANGRLSTWETADSGIHREVLQGDLFRSSRLRGNDGCGNGPQGESSWGWIPACAGMTVVQRSPCAGMTVARWSLAGRRIEVRVILRDGLSLILGNPQTWAPSSQPSPARGEGAPEASSPSLGEGSR